MSRPPTAAIFGGSMSKRATELVDDALALPDGERARLARALMDSLEAGEESETSPAEIERAWLAEVDRRDEEADRDPSLLLPVEEVFAEAQRRLLEIRTRRVRRPQAGADR